MSLLGYDLRTRGDRRRRRKLWRRRKPRDFTVAGFIVYAAAVVWIWAWSGG